LKLKIKEKASFQVIIPQNEFLINQVVSNKVAFGNKIIEFNE